MVLIWLLLVSLELIGPNLHLLIQNNAFAECEPTSAILLKQHHIVYRGNRTAIYLKVVRTYAEKELRTGVRVIIVAIIGRFAIGPSERHGCSVLQRRSSCTRRLVMLECLPLVSQEPMHLDEGVYET
jgi:hypothetical protein